MKLKFDSNQEFQKDAVNAIVDVFDGLPLNDNRVQISIKSKGEGLFANLQQNELGIGNNLSLPENEILKNVHKIQDRNDIPRTPTLQGMDFSVEMETGTGKTYVYLRTIFELNKKYGFNKFVIVVPSVAIREGTLKNLQITQEHFKNLYNNVPLNYAVYDSQKMSIVKNFATSNELQILVINIDAFRKDFTDTDGEDKGVLFHRPNEKLNGYSPREYVQAVHPIVIIDEPQSVDNTPRAKMAISSLNPLCKLRYSATHINPHNLVYKLDPIKASKLKLVKKISVASARGMDGANDTYIKMLSCDNRNGIKAKLEIQIQTPGGPKNKTVMVKGGHDLYTISKNRECYRDGFQVSEISCEPDNQFIKFSPSGIRLSVGEEIGGYGDEIKKIQIKNTIKEHLNKLKQVKERGIKVLSLFFIDRVSNYRVYGEDRNTSKGKYAIWFEQFYNELIEQEEYKGLISHLSDEVCDGYFSEDNNGNWKDSNGATKADESTYDKIMKNKENLLLLEEPLQFIFSHSALREGWDNPNVFQICTLNETNTVMKKRQEIGRGLRLPVNQDGERVFDDSINKLVVFANETYKEFAEKLQNEYEEDCGIRFGQIPKSAFFEISRFLKNKETETTIKQSEEIWMNLKDRGYIDNEGFLTAEFNPNLSSFRFKTLEEFNDIENEIFDIVSGYMLDKHITKYQQPREIQINKRVYLDEEFKKLWEKINKKTTYSVNYSSKELIKTASENIKQMPRIEPLKIQFIKAELDIDNRGVVGRRETKNEIVEIENNFSLPDILSYLQKETNLTRKTIFEILNNSSRLNDFKINPQKFIDQSLDIIRNELNSLIIKGIKYERIDGKVYEMKLFEQGELMSYLDNLLSSKKSVYNMIEYDSEIEKRFAMDLERKESVRLFVKLPSWFTIDTPIGKYNPDWAIIKHEDDTLYFIRETKGTLNFSQLRNSEAYKIRCGEKHFEELDIDFKVVTDAREI
jgi:type III restriction enzyme